jgi:DNA gyrase subunit B
MAADADADTYTADDFRVLEGLEPVRLRPGMYIGSTTSRGLHHLIWEIVDNSVDEALGGHCQTIVVELLEGNVVEVTDDGRGIPVDVHKQTGLSAIDIVFTKLHGGGKFGGGGYKVCMGSEPPSPTPCPPGSKPRSAATASPGPSATNRASPSGR